MKTNFYRRWAVGTIAAVLVLAGGVSWQFIQAQPQPPQDMQNPVSTTPQPADVLPPDIASNGALVEVIRLSQAAVSEEVMSNYVNNSQYRFNLTAGQIIYLKDIGVPDSVVMSMIQRDQQLGQAVSVPPPQAAPAPPPVTTVVNETYFYDSLAPYGTWVNVDGYGRCWRPSVVVYDRTWRPYCDHGRWVYTDSGWYWFSDYSWGWAPFHYGRWFFDDRFGWCWWPDTVWGPSWVTWRYSHDYCGWAPLPPHCYYREGSGLVYNGVTVSVGFDFGFSAAAFIFVDTGHFCDPHPWRFRQPATQVTRIYSQTTVNNITVVNNGNGNTTVVNAGGGHGGHNTTVVNNGIPPEHIAEVTHTPVHPVRIHETTSPVGRGEQIDRSGELVVNRPHFDHIAANEAHDNGPHTIPSPTTGAPMHVPPPGSPVTGNGDQNQQNQRRFQTDRNYPVVTQQPGNQNDNGNNGVRRWNDRQVMTPPVQPQSPPPIQSHPQVGAPVVPPIQNPNNDYPHNQPAPSRPAWTPPSRPQEDQNQQRQQEIHNAPAPRPQENPNPVIVHPYVPAAQPPPPAQPAQDQPRPNNGNNGNGRDKDKNDR